MQIQIMITALSYCQWRILSDSDYSSSLVTSGVRLNGDEWSTLFECVSKSSQTKALLEDIESSPSKIFPKHLKFWFQGSSMFCSLWQKVTENAMTSSGPNLYQDEIYTFISHLIISGFYTSWKQSNLLRNRASRTFYVLWDLIISKPEHPEYQLINWLSFVMYRKCYFPT